MYKLGDCHRLWPLAAPLKAWGRACGAAPGSRCADALAARDRERVNAHGIVLGAGLNGIFVQRNGGADGRDTDLWAFLPAVTLVAGVI
jgi:hypothetical protein